MTLQATSYPPCRRAGKLQATQGFTLIELIIYLAIVSVLATSLILWSLTVSDLGARARAGAELNASGRGALQIITRELESATSVVTPATATPSPTLTLINALSQSVVISLSNGQLTRTVAGGSPLALTAPGVLASDFTVVQITGPWSARPSLSISLTLRASPALARAFTTVVNLRR